MLPEGETAGLWAEPSEGQCAGMNATEELLLLGSPKKHV